MISKEPMLNYSEPTIPNSVNVEVGASYLTPPNEVKRRCSRRLANAPLVLRAPEPQVLLQELRRFGDRLHSRSSG